jgi:hypothetical protein
MCQSSNRPGSAHLPQVEVIVSSDLLNYAVKLPFRHFAASRKRLAPLLAAPAALLLSQGQAKAVLTYNIFESGNDVVVQTSGSLTLTSPETTGFHCGIDGAISSSIGLVCTGADPDPASRPGRFFTYSITGPLVFNGTVEAYPASSVSGIYTMFAGGGEEQFTPSFFSIDDSYTSGDSIVSSARFNNTTLSGLGFTQSSGLIGTWTLTGSGDKIQVNLQPAASGSVPVPSPLPLFGAAAAFSWSRRLRRRISAPMITPGQA